MRKLIHAMVALPLVVLSGCAVSIDRDADAEAREKEQRIIDGVEASDYRELARLDRDGKTFCTGTLIAPRYVLTAGHCLSTREEITIDFPFADADGEVRSSAGTVSSFHSGLDILTQPDVGLVVLDSPVLLDGGDYPYPVLNTTNLGDNTNVIVTGMKENDTDHGSGAYKSPARSIDTFDDNYYRHFGEISRQGDSGGGLFLPGSTLPRTLVGVVQGRSDQDADGLKENYFQRIDTVIDQINAQLNPPSCSGDNEDELRVQLSRMMVHDGKEALSSVLDVQVRITVDGVASGWSYSYPTDKEHLVGEWFATKAGEMGIWGVTRKFRRDECFPVKVEARERDSSFGNSYTQHHVSHELNYCYDASEDAWVVSGTKNRSGTSRKSDGKFDVSMSWRAMRTQACTASTDPSVRLRHARSGQCLFVDGGNGGGTPHWGCWDDPNMRFQLDPVAGGGVRLRHRQSGQCLFGSFDNGAGVGHWECWDDPNMVFDIDIVAGGVRLRHRQSGKCIYATGGNGGSTHLWTCWDDPNMVFQLDVAD